MCDDQLHVPDDVPSSQARVSPVPVPDSAQEVQSEGDAQLPQGGVGGPQQARGAPQAERENVLS